jgi:outer membrane immunogenic protein
MKMKLLLVTASLVALGAAAGSASAADLAARPYTKAPPMVAAVYDWTGFYIGINGGGGFSHSSWSFDGVGDGSHDASGGTVGGQIGYRWQTGQIVWGVEGQGNWADLSGNHFGTFGGLNDHSKIDSFGLITGQVGYAINNVLLYVKGGAAVADVKHSVDNGVGFFASNSNTRWGGTVGAGVEFGFMPGWSVGFEYDHLFLGRDNFNVTPFDFVSVKQDVDLFTARLNYKFGGPVIGRY